MNNADPLGLYIPGDYGIYDSSGRTIGFIIPTTGEQVFFFVIEDSVNIVADYEPINIEQDPISQRNWPILNPYATTPEEPQTCPIADLTPINDQDAQRFENGQTIDTANLTQAMKDGLSCFQSEVQSVGGTFNLTSAYRPPAYQAHLRDVWDKWQAVRHNNTTACQATKQRIQAEYRRHGLLDTQRPALRSAHTRGAAIDANISGLPEGQNVDTTASKCGLYRPLPNDDRVHFIHNR